MSERRVLTLLLLLVLAGAGWLWWSRAREEAAAKKPPVEVEAADRVRADPFPATKLKSRDSGVQSE